MAWFLLSAARDFRDGKVMTGNRGVMPGQPGPARNRRLGCKLVPGIHD